jgi:hypothetical protein
MIPFSLAVFVTAVLDTRTDSDEVISVDVTPLLLLAFPVTETFTSRSWGSGVARLRQAFAGRRSISGRRTEWFSAKPWRMQLLGVGQRSAAAVGSR